MKKDILIKLNSKTGRVNLPSTRLGINGENLQGNIILKFEDEFVDGTAILELERNNEKEYITMTKGDEIYSLPVLSSLLTEVTVINMQVRITVGTGSDIPVWKSNIFYLKVDEAINATTTIPEEYAEWIDIANEKLNEIDNLDLDVNKEGTTSTVTITKKDGTTESVEINDGADGQDGRDGQDGQDGYTPQKGIDYFTEQDIEEMETDVKEDVLDEVYTKSETDTLLQEKADTEDIPDVSSFITKDVNNLTYYTTTANLSRVALTGNYNDLTNKPKINNVELNGNKSLNDLGIQPVGNYALESDMTEVQNDIDHLSKVSNLFEKITGTGTSVTLNDTSDTIMKLNLDTTTSSQEGTPSPSDPQEIHVIKGNNEIKVVGKNLINFEDIQYTITNGYYKDFDTGIVFTEDMVHKIFSISYDIEITNYTGTPDLFFGVTGRTTNPPSMQVQMVAKQNSISSSKIRVKVENVTIGEYVGQHLILRPAGFSTPITGTFSVSNVQMEWGTTSSDFEPYQSQTYPINLGSMELCKIGDYQDYIYKEDGSWYLRKAVRHLSLAIADMNRSDDYPGWSGVPYLGSDYPNYNIPTFPGNEIMSNIGGNRTYFGVSTNGGNSILLLNRSSWNKTQKQWKEQYPNLVVEIYYVLATPTITEITDTTLIEQLDNLEKAYSYDTQTNISQTNNDLPFIINAETYKEINLTDYVKNTDYATSSKGGTIKTTVNYATYVNPNNGQLSAETKTYEKYTNGSNSMFISKGTLENILTGRQYLVPQDIVGKQNIEDNSLTTTNKTIPTAINEVNSIAKGANQALSYASYSAMVTAFNSLDDDEYNVGQNVYIVTTEVPDLWVSSVESTSSTYTYVDDATIVSALQTNGYIQVGYYKLSMLETQKVDLTNYVKNTDYSSLHAAGVVKMTSGSGLTMYNGYIFTDKATNQQIDAKSSQNRVIVPYNLDYAVKCGIVSNSITLTDNEKDTVLQWIGGQPSGNYVTNTDYASTTKPGLIQVVPTYGTNINSQTGGLIGQTRDYSQYTSASNLLIIAKGTLENVITGKELDLKKLSTFDSTKTQVLKNINGTLTWVNE